MNLLPLIKPLSEKGSRKWEWPQKQTEEKKNPRYVISERTNWRILVFTRS